MPEQSPLAIAIHGGAGPAEDFIKQNLEAYKQALKDALEAGYSVLKEGGTAISAVEKAVCFLENNELFNAGFGSALNAKGAVEMDASVMDGAAKKAGAVAGVTNVKNPVSLARLVMQHTNHVLLGATGAMEFAEQQQVELAPPGYFISEHQQQMLAEEQHEQKDVNEKQRQYIHGTVGAVALDAAGNLAAATSTGGITNSLSGRIGDSCIIGAGCYADNNTCAVSGTGDGEYLINGVVAHAVASAVEYRRCSLQQACDLVVHEKNKGTDGDIGVISVDRSGSFGMSFNSERMHRGWVSSSQPLQVHVY